MEAKRHTHDCDRCIFLGPWEKYDLYYCPGKDTVDTTVIARYGSLGDNYRSGLTFAKPPFVTPANPLTEALSRAIRDGLCDQDGHPIH